MMNAFSLAGGDFRNSLKNIQLCQRKNKYLHYQQIIPA